MKEIRPAARAGGARIAIEAAAWVVAAALVSPLATYAGSSHMPLPALFGVAAGIAVGLALTGRRLHGVLLSEGLSSRSGAGRFFLAAGLTLLGALLVLVASVVALLLLRAAMTGRTPGLLGTRAS